MKTNTTEDNGKRNFESKFDENKLRAMINAGNSADEIKEALGLVSKQSLRQHILKLINIDRQFYEVPGLYIRNTQRPVVNFKGEIRLSKKMLEFPGSTYSHNDQFEIQADNDRIVLTRIKDSPGSETQEDIDNSPHS